MLKKKIRMKKKIIKPVRINSFWSNNYVEYVSNGERNKTLSVEEYLNEIRPHLRDIINNLENLRNVNSNK